MGCISLPSALRSRLTKATFAEPFLGRATMVQAGLQNEIVSEANLVGACLTGIGLEPKMSKGE